MKKLAITMLLVGSTLLVANGASTYAKKCAGCHGKHGEKSALGKTAVITGESAISIVKKLNGYKAGVLSQYGMGSLMKSQVTSMNDTTIKALANYIATMK